MQGETEREGGWGEEGRGGTGRGGTEGGGRGGNVWPNSPKRERERQLTGICVRTTTVLEDKFRTKLAFFFKVELCSSFCCSQLGFFFLC